MTRPNKRALLGGAALPDRRNTALIRPGQTAGPFGPIEGDPGPVVAAVWALDESTFKNASVMDWNPEQATMELTARLQMIGLG